MASVKLLPEKKAKKIGKRLRKLQERFRWHLKEHKGKRQDYRKPCTIVIQDYREGKSLKKASKEGIKHALEYYTSILPLMLKGADKKESKFWNTFMPALSAEAKRRGIRCVALKATGKKKKGKIE